MTANRPIGRVLRAEELGLYRDAAGALVSAREAATRHVAEAQRQAAALRAQAQSEGLAAGQTEAVRAIADAMAHVRCRLQELGPAIAAAIADGVAAIIGELDHDERIARAAAHAVATLDERTRISVRVAPRAAPAVRRSLQDQACVVIEDAALGPDECLIDTEGGFVRAGIVVQLRALRDALGAAA